MEKQNKSQIAPIVRPLLAWYAQNARALPWRRDRAPYHVWVSEIMLQQTRVEAVKGYYTRFLDELPDIAALADCPEERLMKLWEGLGYYRRARNLQKGAQQIMAQHNGIFPGEYDDIRALAGIGDYTAGAIASICFHLPVPAVDGNVLRIMARWADCHEEVDTTITRRTFSEALRTVYPADATGDFTQALMELGATVCTPRSPRCEGCPVQAWCEAHAKHTQAQLPVYKAKRARRIEERTVFLLCTDDRIAIQKRPAGGLLGGMWELPAIERALSAQDALEQARAWGLSPVNMRKTLHHVHVFTHIEWHMTCHVIGVAEPGSSFTWATRGELADDYALPSAFKPFLEEFLSFLPPAGA